MACNCRTYKHTWHPIFSWKYGPKGMDRVCETKVAGRMYDAWEHPGLLVKHFSLQNNVTKGYGR